MSSKLFILSRLVGITANPVMPASQLNAFRSQGNNQV
jgi:hypothetical protein